MRPRLWLLAASACLGAALSGQLEWAAAGQAAVPLGPATDVAPGVALYHVTDPAQLSPPAPVSIWLLRVDPRQADVSAALANDEIVDTETVPEIAARRGAVAAVNAGFFLLPTGDPAGIYKLNGQLVSDTIRPRGAVGIVRRGQAATFIFGRVAASMRMRIVRPVRRDITVGIDGVDTVRRPGQLILFTPAYDQHTGTSAGGLEWVLEGRPLRVRGRSMPEGNSPIPRNGFVLSYGGNRPPPALAALRPGARLDLDTLYAPLDAQPRQWAEADDIIGGAGLLVRDGRPVEDWSAEKLNPGFAESRHPRTAIGTHPDGSVWLVTIDGRQPQLSAGMTLVEVRDLALRLGLTNALNLDGGGSTTMWVAGRIVNSPSDPSGPRKVSDALLVMPRPPNGPAKTG